MNPFNILWIEIVKRPIFNLLLVLLALFGGNLGRAIIVLTLLIRLLLIKNAMAANAMQGQMGDFQPKMQEVQDKYKDDPQQMSAEMMKLMKTSGGGPLKWCLQMLVQIPVFLWLLYTVKDITFVMQDPTKTITTTAYSFLSNFNVDWSALKTTFLGIDLLSANNIALTVLAAILMYAQMKGTTALKGKPTGGKMWWAMSALWGDKMPDMGKMMWGMNIFFVFMMAMFVWSMPAAIGLYIVTTTLFGVAQMAYQYRALLKAKFLARQGKTWGPQIIEPK